MGIVKSSKVSGKTLSTISRISNGRVSTSDLVSKSTTFCAKGTTAVPYTLNYVIVAGGGGGGSANPGGPYSGGGGGAGGVVAGSIPIITKGCVITVTVGSGGNLGGCGIPNGSSTGTPGGPSYLTTPLLPAPSVTAIGGGGGASWNNYSQPSPIYSPIGHPGGSGGGGFGSISTAYPVISPGYGCGTPGQGHPGGSGIYSPYGAGAGGGGGAGGAGSPSIYPAPPTTFSIQSSGGVGVLAKLLGPVPSIPPASPLHASGGYVGGGGGGSFWYGILETAICGHTQGGLGGGGGGVMYYCFSVIPSLVNTGGGGAGGMCKTPSKAQAGSGSSGTVIISAPTPRIGTAGPPSAFITGTDGAGNTWIQFLSSGTYTA
jgi:hypothetical protein